MRNEIKIGIGERLYEGQHRVLSHIYNQSFTQILSTRISENKFEILMKRNQ